MPSTNFHTQADLNAALGALVQQDPRLAPVLATAHMPALRQRPAGFAGLAAIICGQQLSTFAAAAIWDRIVKAFGEPTHTHFRAARSDRLRRLGLSAAKIKTLKQLASAIDRGELDLAVLAGAAADAAHERLTALHGIGPWSADIYLLFCLGHGDAWPAGDLALQEAVRLALGLNTRPTTKEMATIAEAWRPYRGAAAHLFWAYYRASKAKAFEAAPGTAPSTVSRADQLQTRQSIAPSRSRSAGIIKKTKKARGGSVGGPS